MKENDVFSWKYINDFGIQRDIYWCKSRIAIVDSQGNLYDTYWNAGSDRYCLNNKLDEIELTFIANLNDLENVSIYNAKLYANKDIVDLRHPNNSGSDLLFKRKGSNIDDKLYLGSLSNRIIDIDEKIKSLVAESDCIKNELANIEKMSYNPFWMSSTYYINNFTNYKLVWYIDRYYTIIINDDGTKYIYNQNSLSQEYITVILSLA